MRLFRQVWTLTAAARLLRQESNPLMMKDSILLSQIAYIRSQIDDPNSFIVANYAKLRHVFGCNCSIERWSRSKSFVFCVYWSRQGPSNLPTHVLIVHIGRYANQQGLLGWLNSCLSRSHLHSPLSRCRRLNHLNHPYASCLQLCPSLSPWDLLC